MCIMMYWEYQLCICNAYIEVAFVMSACQDAPDCCTLIVQCLLQHVNVACTSFPGTRLVAQDGGVALLKMYF
jgi:hypothetical protein